MNQFQNKIKEIAGWLSDKTKKIYSEFQNNYQNATLERFFEIMLKLLTLFIIISILRLPFLLFGFIGHGMFNYMDFPGIVWYGFGSISVRIIYLVLVITTILLVFKDELFKKGKPAKRQVQKPKEPVINQTINEDSWLTVAKIVLKIMVFVIFIIPLIAGMFSLMIAMALIIYLITKGLTIYGVLLLLMGLFFLLTFLLKTILAVTSGKKTYLWTLVVSIILILSGAIGTVDWLLGLDIKQNQANKIIVKTFYLNRYEYHNYEYMNAYFIDNTVPGDKIKLKVYYDADYDGLLFFDRYGIRRVHINDATKFKKLTDYLIDNLKNDKLYIPYFKTEVYANKFVINEIR